MSSAWGSVDTLEPDECLRLLSMVRIGRIGLCTPQGPRVLPVSHAVLDGTVVFRTGIYTTIADATRGATVAYEADEIDDRMVSGWSVHVVGRAEHVQDHATVADIFERMPEPWAPGPRPLVARIVPTEMTGRRFRRT